MPDYSQGKIYQILNTITDDVYIGSTTQLLCNRMKHHRNTSKEASRSHYKIYQAFAKYGVDNFYIELIEKCPCTTKEELCAREGHYIRQERSSLNSRIEGRTSKEYYNDNKELILHKQQEYNKINHEARMVAKMKYYIDNKDKILTQVKEYATNNREVVLASKKASNYKHREIRLMKQKEYAELHTEQIAKYQKEYHDAHREFNSEKIQCTCGCIVSRGCLTKHKRTQKHQDVANPNI